MEVIDIPNLDTVARNDLTTSGTAPGRWVRSAFTTWKMSTVLSILLPSMALQTEQKIPDLVTVSLKKQQQKLLMEVLIVLHDIP